MFNCLIDTEGLFKVTGSHVGPYIVKVVVYRKLCKTETS